MYSLRCLANIIMTAAIATAIATPNKKYSAPSCGGDKAVCCSGDYQAAGELVSNCITYTPQSGVCHTDSNIYCCFTCEFAIGSCVGCSHFY